MKPERQVAEVETAIHHDHVHRDGDVDAVGSDYRRQKSRAVATGRGTSPRWTCDGYVEKT